MSHRIFCSVRTAVSVADLVAESRSAVIVHRDITRCGIALGAVQRDGNPHGGASCHIPKQRFVDPALVLVHKSHTCLS
ncbi:Hypothetical predicted protein, partial [Olea europaea subsp. europaea]